MAALKVFLSTDIRSTQNINTFKKKLETFLFYTAFQLPSSRIVFVSLAIQDWLAFTVTVSLYRPLLLLLLLLLL